MLINKLPKEIQDRVKEIQSEQRNPFNVNIDLQSGYGTFTWIKTREGDGFWQAINRGQFDIFYEMYPIENLKEIEEDLFKFFNS